MFQPYVSLIGDVSVLREIQTGRLQLWVIGEVKDEKERVALGVVATSIVTDHFTGERNLLVSLLHKAKPDVKLNEELWIDGILHLKLYARQQGCKKIVAFSGNERVIEMFEKLGGNASVRFLQMEV